MALGSSEPLREMSTRNVLGVRDKGGLVLRADNLHMLSKNPGSLNLQDPYAPVLG